MTGGETQAGTEARRHEGTKGPGAAARSRPRLSPWWLRLIVYFLLVVAAVGAIRVIDRHVMQHATVMSE